MSRFDPNRPHSEVHGIIGVRYLQDGHTFSGSGEPAVGIEPNIPVDLPSTDKETAEAWPSMRRMPDGSYVEAVPPPLILGPDGLPAKKEAAHESLTSDSPPPPASLPLAPPMIPKDDMRTKENKMVKIQWEQFHEGEDFPGVAEAKRILGIA